MQSRRRRAWIVGILVLLAGAAFWSARPPVIDPDRLSATLALHVDLSERTLYAEIDGGETITWDIAVGAAEHPTPRGSFRIRRMIWNPSWVPPDSEWARDLEPKAPGEPDNPMGRVKMYFRDPAYYIHGTPYEETVPSASSHGCVRMRNEDAVELARLVMEHGGEPRDPSWFRRILNRVTSSHEVILSDPVPLEIVP